MRLARTPKFKKELLEEFDSKAEVVPLDLGFFFFRIMK
jgi:hypothetical protein